MTSHDVQGALQGRCRQQYTSHALDLSLRPFVAHACKCMYQPCATIPGYQSTSWSKHAVPGLLASQWADRGDPPSAPTTSKIVQPT